MVRDAAAGEGLKVALASWEPSVAAAAEDEKLANWTGKDASKEEEDTDGVVG